MTSLCPTCCTRFDSCSECHAQEIAKRDEEIGALKSDIINYRAALRGVIDYDSNCLDENEDTGETCGGCPWCIATETLEEK